MNEIKEGQTLTPEKIANLISLIQIEIQNLRNALKSKNFGDAGYILLQSQISRLQALVKKLLEKKGVLTPSETNSALDALKEAKRTRLEGDYKAGIRRSAVFLVILGVAVIGTYVLIKNVNR